MARHQDRTWYVLPVSLRMTWSAYEECPIDIEVLAFSFDGDMPIWLTVNGVVVEDNKVRKRLT